MIHLVLTESQPKSLHVRCFQIADCPNIFFHKREVMQDTDTGGAFMKRTLHTPPPKKKKKCNELFSKADGFGAFIFIFIFMKVKVTPTQ